MRAGDAYKQKLATHYCNIYKINKSRKLNYGTSSFNEYQIALPNLPDLVTPFLNHLFDRGRTRFYSYTYSPLYDKLIL